VMTFNLRVRTILDGPNIWDRRCELVVQRVRAFDPHCSAPRKAWPRWKRSCVSSSAITPSSASDAATENVAEKCAACSSRPPASNCSTVRAVSVGLGPAVRRGTLSAARTHRHDLRLAICPDQEPWLLLCSEDQTARVWDLSCGVHLATFTADRPLRRAGISPDDLCGRPGCCRPLHLLRLKGSFAYTGEG
jgi:hypothetical protein